MRSPESPRSLAARYSGGPKHAMAQRRLPWLPFGVLGIVAALAVVGIIFTSGVLNHGPVEADRVTPTSTPSVAPTVESPAPMDAATLRRSFALTPPMGWNSWNQVGCAGLNEQVVKNAADAMVARGLQAVGYQYIVIDDCYQSGRDADGNLIVDPARFPSGMAAVAKYVHDKGLKFGIYAVPGSQTCANYFDRYPVKGIGSLGHEQQDVDLFVSWGIDYLKYDWCRADINDGLSEQAAFGQMNDILLATGRPIVYSISEYGEQEPWVWAPGIANLWRTTHDIHENWPSILQHINLQVPVTSFATPGAWNDPDMLHIGNGDISVNETITHFGIWCMLAAPLFTGTDLSALPESTISLLTNPELIEIDQDTKGVEATQVRNAGGAQVWSRPLADGSFAVALFNTSRATKTITASLAEVGIPQAKYTVRDVINRAPVGSTTTGISGSVAAHGLSMVRVTPLSAEDQRRGL